MFPTFYIEFQHSYISHRILQDSTSSEYYISHILLHVISKIPPVLPPLRAEGGGMRFQTKYIPDICFREILVRYALVGVVILLWINS